MKREMFIGATPEVFAYARQNRSAPTAAEQRLWEEFLRHKPNGYKFRRQHPLQLFIANFYCHALKLVIEPEGSVHDRPEARQADMERQDYLEKQGLTVVCFRNSEVMEKLPEVMRRIQSFFYNHTSPL